MNLSESLQLVKKYCNYRDSSNDSVVIAMLNASKPPESTPVSGYRPFIVAATLLWNDSATKRGGIIQADDNTKWLTPDQIKNSIMGLLSTQKSFDSGVTGIPEGWRVEDKFEDIFKDEDTGLVGIFIV